jgi:hypothetical protein
MTEMNSTQLKEVRGGFFFFGPMSAALFKTEFTIFGKLK